jgi:hypothetical protein
MDAARLNDRVARGLGQAARHLGEGYDAFRPHGAVDPLSRGNLMLRLSVVCGRLPRRKGEVTFGAAVGCGHVSGLFARFMTAGPDAIRSLAPNQFCALRRAAR